MLTFPVCKSFHPIQKNFLRMALHKSSLIGLSVNVPIFRGFAVDARIENARLQQQKNLNNIEALKLSIDKDVQQAINNYSNALATLDAQKRNMDLAETVYNQTQLKF